MDNKNHQKNSKKISLEREMFYDYEPDLTDFRAASATEATGLIPSGPVDNAEIESYQQTYNYRALMTDEDSE